MMFQFVEPDAGVKIPLFESVVGGVELEFKLGVSPIMMSSVIGSKHVFPTTTGSMRGVGCTLVAKKKGSCKRSS